MPSVAMKRGRARLKLQSALLESKDVQSVRVFDRADTVNGFVVALSDEWFLMRVVGYRLEPDGWSALRLRDLMALERQDTTGDASINMRVFEARGEWPPRSPASHPMTDLASIIGIAMQIGSLVAVHREAGRPDTYWVGRAIAVDAEHLSIIELDHQGFWRDRKVFEVDDVTRVDFGGEYLRNLALVAGEPPS